MLQCDADVIGIEEGFLGLIERNVRELSYRDVSGILNRGGTILGTHNKANPFQYYGRDGEDVSDEVVDYCNSLGLDAIVALGGDGTMTICHQFQQKGVNFVGVPKTIDNDLMHTDRTFGFDTAVATATEAIDRLQTTGRSHNRVMICETMGRYSGWIALHAGMAGGADVILIPEFPFSVEEVARVCRARRDKQKFTIISVAEGARIEGEDMVVRETDEESTDPIKLGGIGNYIRERLEPLLDSEIRTTVLGHIQRGGTPTPFDRVLATNFGTYAAGLVAQGKFGRMVALQDNALSSVPLASVADQNRRVPRDSTHIRAAYATGVSLGLTGQEFSIEDLKDPQPLS
jgi:6-phosphofructokinase 1